MAPSLTVSDLHRSVAWYQDVLGFVVAEEWTHEGRLAGVRMRAGVVDFLLNQDDFAKGRDRKKGEGLRFYCRTVQDVDELARAIRSRGGTLAQEPTTHPWGVRDLAVVDPDGFKISIGNWGM
jgi:catechol 2,3-dioxygenase-like lactoylglutathione lyase family enzyme